MDKRDILEKLDVANFYKGELPLLRVSGNGGQATAPCPFHQDAKPSLSLDMKKGLFFCHSCGEKGDVFAFYQKRNGGDFKNTLRVLAARAGVDVGGKTKLGRIVATYDYTDAAGTVLFQVVRYDPKRFLQRRPDGKGGWRWNLDGVRLIPYGLPDIPKAREVFILEGEKDCETLKALGLVASCNPQGAGKWRADYNTHFQGKAVFILPDKDDPGRKHGTHVAVNLAGTAASVKVVELPGNGKDFSDWVEARRADGLATAAIRAEFLAVANAAPEWEPLENPAGEAALVASVHPLNPRHDQKATTTATAHRLTDVGNARRFVDQARGVFRYVIELQKWIVFTGQRWEFDQSAATLRLARQAVRQIYSEAERATDPDRRRALAQHAMRSESEARLTAMISLARSEPEIPISVSKLDADPWALTCLNGTLNLQTFEFAPHRAGDFITKISPVTYDPGAYSVAWNQFLNRTLPDEATRRYVQKAAGYSLTGKTNMEKLFFAYGPPATGKTTFLSTLAAVLGDYAATADFDTFLQRDFAGGGARNDIARLVGKRFVQSIEVTDGQKFAEALINQLTGGDTIAARYLYKESFEFRPEFKIWLAANHRPRVSGPEGAIWRRLVQIPFTVGIPEEERDPGLKTRLNSKEELAGVLSWLVAGCRLWQEEGLREPDAIKEMISEYKAESDTLRDFIDERCVVAPTAQAKNSDLWAAYLEWAKTGGERPLGRKSFAQALFARGLDQYKHKERLWIGIGLLRDDPT